MFVEFQLTNTFLVGGFFSQHNFFWWAIMCVCSLLLGQNSFHCDCSMAAARGSATGTKRPASTGTTLEHTICMMCRKVHPRQMALPRPIRHKVVSQRAPSDPLTCLTIQHRFVRRSWWMSNGSDLQSQTVPERIAPSVFERALVYTLTPKRRQN